jgi:hypothetical protein
MKVNDVVGCIDFPCLDTHREAYRVPGLELDPDRVSIFLISEAAASNPADGYYAGPQALFARTTLLAFQDAGAQGSSLQDILNLGVYFTTAVKCAKTAPGLSTTTVENCSYLLEKELSLFSNVKVFLLMGDVAIKSINLIARRCGQPRPIPPGSTYKIRTGKFTFRGARALPSYVQAGPAFFVEKSKRRMIAEDIKNALLIADL